LSPEPFFYPIIDTEVCRARGLDAGDLAEACLRAGARVLQLRAKDDSTAAMLTLADRIVAAAKPLGALVIVNDRADVALMSGADGVHVGQEDLPVEAVRDMLGPSAIIGVSTHNPEQIDRALETSASYVAVGPVFATGTKDTGYSARGLDLVASAAGRGKPVVAIGGITLERARAVAAAGASGIAVITDLLAADGAEAQVRRFVAALPGQPFKV
jgi:thiamine-phosphate pyrophosphorylase